MLFGPNPNLFKAALKKNLMFLAGKKRFVCGVGGTVCVLVRAWLVLLSEIRHRACASQFSKCIFQISPPPPPPPPSPLGKTNIFGVWQNLADFCLAKVCLHNSVRKWLRVQNIFIINILGLRCNLFLMQTGICYEFKFMYTNHTVV